MRHPVSPQDGNRYKFEHDNPFLDEDEEDEVAPVGYRYRKWCLGNDINLVARTEHDSVQAAPNNEIQFINIKVWWWGLYFASVLVGEERTQQIWMIFLLPWSLIALTKFFFCLLCLHIH